MNYEKRLMNAPASNHFPDKYAHTYSFSSQPAPLLLNPHPPSKSAFFSPFLAGPCSNFTDLQVNTQALPLFFFFFPHTDTVTA